MKLFQNVSKKLVGFLVFVAVLLLNKKFELGLSETELMTLAGGSAAYSLGQGIADFGKGKVQAEATNGRTTITAVASSAPK